MKYNHIAIGKKEIEEIANGKGQYKPLVSHYINIKMAKRKDIKVFKYLSRMGELPFYLMLILKVSIPELSRRIEISRDATEKMLRKASYGNIFRYKQVLQALGIPEYITDKLDNNIYNIGLQDSSKYVEFVHDIIDYLDDKYYKEGV